MKGLSKSHIYRHLYSSSFKKKKTNSYESNAIPKKSWHAEFCMIPHYISPFLLPPSPSIIKASFGAFHPRGREKSNLSRFGMFGLEAFPQAVKAWDFPTASSNIHCGITKVSEKNVSGTENLRVAVFKARSFDEVSNDKGFRFIYIDLSWSIYVYGFDWPWPCWNTTHPLDLLLVEGDHFQELQKPHESTTWKEQSGA